MRKAIGYAAEYKKELWLALLLILLSVIAGVMPYFVANKMIVGFLDGASSGTGGIFLACAAIAALLILKSMLNAVGITLSHKAAYGTLYEMRKKFGDKIATMPLGDVTANGSGFYKKKIIDDIGSLEVAIAHIFVEGIPNLLIPAIVLFIIFINDWRMGILSLGSLPISFFAMRSMMSNGMKKMPGYYGAQSKLNNTIIDYIAGMDVVKIFGQTKASYKKYAADVENYREYAYDWTASSWLPMSVIGVVLPCTVVLTLPVGLLLYSTGSLSLHTFIFTLLLDLSLGMPLHKAYMFVPTIPNLNYAVEALEKSFESPGVQTGEDQTIPDHAEVVFDKVSFSYENEDVLKQVSFQAKPGTLTALVGPSGGGKSTIARLLVHFWDVRDGSIMIGGKDIREYTADALADAISFVSQDSFLFDGTILENIRIGKPDASEEEVYVAAKAAACHDFIKELPAGYDTQVGLDGGKLSGGEKQRITIARAILKDVPIIVLDEATAYIDTENEDLIQSAIHHLLAGKTVIMIAHRLHNVVDADQIIVVDKGELIAQGTHEDLFAKCQLYQKLWKANTEVKDWQMEV